MVLPIQSLPGGKQKNKNKKGKKDAGDGVQVNLIVDPSMFGDPRASGNNEGDSEGGSNIFKAAKGRRRGVFEGLAMEEQWRAARKQMQQTLSFDIACFFLWGALFVVILLGKRCPVGKFDGW